MKKRFGKNLDRHPNVLTATRGVEFDLQKPDRGVDGGIPLPRDSKNGFLRVFFVTIALMFRFFPPKPSFIVQQGADNRPIWQLVEVGHLEDSLPNLISKPNRA